MGLQISKLTKEFGKLTAVNDLSLSMETGVYGLLGVNGAGKTTLMRMLCTLLHPTSGSITWDGWDIFQMDAEYRRMLGYLPQDFGSYPDFSIEDYLMYIASIKGLRSATAKRRTEQLLHQVGLYDVRSRKMRKLSGGMKRRSGIAQALLNDPQILILDEPTAGLDPSERIRFRNLISEIAEDRLVLLSTHIVSDVEYIAREILLMKDGRIVCSGTSEALIKTMGDCVWSLSVSRNEIDGYMQRYKTANVRTGEKGTELRLISDIMPSPDAQRIEATLEDVFLYYFGQEAGEDNGSV